MRGPARRAEGREDLKLSFKPSNAIVFMALLNWASVGVQHHESLPTQTVPIFKWLACLTPFHGSYKDICLLMWLNKTWYRLVIFRHTSVLSDSMLCGWTITEMVTNYNNKSHCCHYCSLDFILALNERVVACSTQPVTHQPLRLVWLW